jgi:hypothetical protein
MPKTPKRGQDQHEAFVKAARELDTDEDEDAEAVSVSAPTEVCAEAEGGKEGTPPRLALEPSA